MIQVNVRIGESPFGGGFECTVNGVKKLFKETLEPANKMKKDKFIIICPKCQGEEVSFGHSIYDEIMIRCENKDCKHKGYA